MPPVAEAAFSGPSSPASPSALLPPSTAIVVASAVVVEATNDPIITSVAGNLVKSVENAASVAASTTLAVVPMSNSGPIATTAPTTAITASGAVADTASVRRSSHGKTICEHGRRQTQCVTCFDLGVGGGSICKHRRRKDGCRICRVLTQSSSDLLLAARARKWLYNPPRPWESSTLSPKMSVLCHNEKTPTSGTRAVATEASPAAAPPTKAFITIAPAVFSRPTIQLAAHSPPLPSPTSTRIAATSPVSQAVVAPPPDNLWSGHPPPLPYTCDHDLEPQLNDHLHQLDYLRLQNAQVRAATATLAAALHALPAHAAYSEDCTAIAGRFQLPIYNSSLPTHPQRAVPVPGQQPLVHTLQHSGELPAAHGLDFLGTNRPIHASHFPGQQPPEQLNDRYFECTYTSSSAAAAPSTAKAVAAHLSRFPSRGFYTSVM